MKLLQNPLFCHPERREGSQVLFPPLSREHTQSFRYVEDR
jgi:hypothetical protein